MKRQITSLLTTLFLLVGLSACATTGYDAYDYDGDSYFSEDEVSAGLYDTWDTDDDGLLDDDEWNVGVGMDDDFGVWDDDFGVWDEDDDGFVDDDEFGVGFDDSGMFDMWDTDDDGLLDDDEFGDIGVF